MTARQPKGIPVGGQFATETRSEPGVALAAPGSYDAKAVAEGIFTDLRDLYVEWTRALVYDTRQSILAGESTHQDFIDSLLAKNHGGRCKEHEFDRFDTEIYCHDCLTSLMVEARTNPKPAPSPRGVIPGPPQHHHLTGQQLSYDYDEEFLSSTTTTKMTGDEKFEAAIRRMFNAPADAPVEIIQEDTESGTEWTRETNTEITVKCDGRKAVYSYMGSLMKALDQAQQDPHTMALRFMRATSAPRPLLKGVAAVYLHQAYGNPKPVFGKVRNVFSGADGKFMDFLHTDGRREYLYLNRVTAILETDQSWEYNDPTVLPKSAAKIGPILEKRTDEAGFKHTTRAVEASPELQDQIRSYLRADPSDPVEVRQVKTRMYSAEDEEFVISCAGRQEAFYNLEILLSNVAV